ncbi:MAG: hypothetical protein IJW16_03175 [Clostridia bacterium]|nr:hypothetical protein [Clostridia bacterium]
MSDVIFDFLLYFLQLVGLTLGVIVVCGFAVRFFSRTFARLSGTGFGKIFDLTAAIGTPIHELGHAIMCLIFAHRITRIKLWSPSHEGGVYGYVEHNYNRKNPWARLGSLFIGVGPIFSGLAVTVLMLWLCFPSEWGGYLDASRAMLATQSAGFGDYLSTVVSLFLDIFRAFGDNWVRSLIGILIILPVSLHVSLSWQDIKSAAGALPLYLLLIILFAIPTLAFGASAAIVDWLWLWNLRAMSLFCLVIAFSAVWVILALLMRAIRIVVSWF